MESEHNLNPQLEKYLNVQARHEEFSMVYFHNEEPQAVSRRADISVTIDESVPINARYYTKYELVLVMECKRLPADRADREREYVTGRKGEKKSGGIQRFKLGLHGAAMDIAVMIGFIQKDMMRHWQEKINEWIRELINEPTGDGCVWGADKLLTRLEENISKGIARYHSAHKRTGDEEKNEIVLHHLWIKMN